MITIAAFFGVACLFYWLGGYCERRKQRAELLDRLNNPQGYLGRGFIRLRHRMVNIEFPNEQDARAWYMSAVEVSREVERNG